MVVGRTAGEGGDLGLVCERSCGRELGECSELDTALRELVECSELDATRRRDGPLSRVR